MPRRGRGRGRGKKSTPQSSTEYIRTTPHLPHVDNETYSLTSEQSNSNNNPPQGEPNSVFSQRLDRLEEAFLNSSQERVLFRQIMAEIQAKMERLTETMNSTNAVIETLKRPSVSQTQNTKINETKNQPNSHVEKLKMKMYYNSLPKFNNEGFINPYKFLEEFERITNKLQVDNQTKADWLVMSVKVENEKWAQLVKDHHALYSTLKEDFINTFWDREAQMLMKSKIANHKIDFKNTSVALDELRKLAAIVLKMGLVFKTPTEAAKVLFDKLPYNYKNRVLSQLSDPNSLIEAVQTGIQAGLPLYNEYNKKNEDDKSENKNNQTDQSWRKPTTYQNSSKNA